MSCPDTTPQLKPFYKYGERGIVFTSSIVTINKGIVFKDCYTLFWPPFDRQTICDKNSEFYRDIENLFKYTESSNTNNDK